MRRHTDPSSTSNEDAKALIAAAQSKCEGCRLSWRLDKRRGWRHREPMPIECRAQAERLKLREIAERRVENRDDLREAVEALLPTIRSVDPETTAAIKRVRSLLAKGVAT